MVGTPAAAGRGTALAVLGALVLAAVPPAVAAAPPPAPGPAPSAAQTVGADRPSPEMLRALQRDLRLTADQAAARLINEAEAGARAGRLRNALGERFAGAWVRGTTSARLTVATTDARDVPAIRAQGAAAAVMKTSLAGLRAVKDRLDAAAARVRTTNTPLWYVDVPGNRVVVQAVDRAAGAAFVKAAGVDPGQVAVRVSAQRPRLLADIVGGDPYYINNSARCSVGFSVTRGDQEGFVTAGHCGAKGDSTTGPDNRTAQGTFQDSVFPGKDMAWVGVNSGWTATPYVEGEGGQRVQVEGSVEALEGASVCRSGSTTGWHCGTIEQRDTSVSYAEGTVDGLTRTTVCAEPGDSGGPFLAGSQAQGVTSGGSGDCTSGGTTFFQPVNDILSAYGLTLKTVSAPSSGAPADPGEGGADAWAAGRVYRAGATVTRAGVRYRCLQTHQAQTVWSPEGTPALWQRL
ncbi:trypsin-like serine protease [Streptomyces echinoruber]|uniref:Serine protease n=1 Tax=Streptomyces echinoruber TaxID=68898 RepID=A0A918RCH4_9ACTN|nr:alpha-lytic protease prodomain-containing protein [Streptomyces echinoruber]GGZ91696.1 serine protease [Streptomyces echinoruber]